MKPQPYLTHCFFFEAMFLSIAADTAFLLHSGTAFALQVFTRVTVSLSQPTCDLHEAGAIGHVRVKKTLSKPKRPGLGALRMRCGASLIKHIVIDGKHSVSRQADRTPGASAS